MKHLVERLKGLSVLNVGAAGDVWRYLPEKEREWIHARVDSVASDLVGVDIDSKAVSYAKEFGWHLRLADCKTMKLGQQFDAAIMVEVVEHVDAPAHCIANVLGHLKPGGKLYLTTPNPSYVGDVVRAVCGKAPAVFWDHQMVFAPEHMRALCKRHGFKLDEVTFFTGSDKRSLRLRLKTAAVRLLGAINPRLHTSWMGVISK